MAEDNKCVAGRNLLKSDYLLTCWLAPQVKQSRVPFTQPRRHFSLNLALHVLHKSSNDQRLCIMNKIESGSARVVGCQIPTLSAVVAKTRRARTSIYRVMLKYSGLFEFSGYICTRLPARVICPRLPICHSRKED